MDPHAPLFFDDFGSSATSCASFRAAYVRAFDAAGGRDDNRPFDQSLRVVNAVFEALSSVSKGGILLNSSTGKDSTLMTAVVIDAMLLAAKAGRYVPQVIIGISDTRAEFPEMAQRMRDEADALNRFAGEYCLPLQAIIVGPKSTSTLLVEIIGNGLALPPHGKATSLAGASWCMPRVKGAPLDRILERALEEFDFVVQMLGVREDESLRRAKTISGYSEGLPFGLTRIAQGPAVNRRQGCIPIVHWSDRDIKDWMSSKLAAWDFTSLDNLREIYAKGSMLEDRAGECSIVVTKEGAVSNVCSDLSGTRFGCWMCLMSKNRTLTNHARKDSRYVWLRKFHNYVYLHHKRGERQRRSKSRLGFNTITCFPKGFTLNERARMLALLFRAEMESGFTLIAPDELENIDRVWARRAVAGLTTAAVRRAAVSWRATGKLRFEWEETAADPWHDEFVAVVSSSILGASHQDPRRFDIAHMVAAAGASQMLAPRLKAWVLTAPRDSRRQVVVISDDILTLGGRAQGLVFGNWALVGSREPLAWEHAFSAGRNFVYMLEPSVHLTREQELSYSHNQEIIDRRSTCEADLYLFDHYAASDLITELAGSVAEADWHQLRHIISHLVQASDCIEDIERESAATFSDLRRQLGVEEVGLFDSRGTPVPAHLTRKMAVLRKAMRPFAKASAALSVHIRKPLATLYELMRDRKVNAALLERLVYLERTSIYDQAYALLLERELRQLLSMKEPSRFEDPYPIAA